VSTRGVSLDGADRHTISTTMLSRGQQRLSVSTNSAVRPGKSGPGHNPASSQWRERLEVATSRCASRQDSLRCAGQLVQPRRELRCNTTEVVSPATDDISHQGALSLP
jgi:hypothetical protein